VPLVSSLAFPLGFHVSAELSHTESPKRAWLGDTWGSCFNCHVLTAEVPPSDVAAAVDELERSAGERPVASDCLELARGYERLGDPRTALRWALAATDAAEEFSFWQAAVGLARRNAMAGDPSRRTVRLALLGSYTTNQFADMLWLAALRIGVALELYESPYGQYRQEILDPASPMYAFSPELVVLAVHAGELALPAYSTAPEDDIATEVERWRSLWRTLGGRSSATIVQHLFALPTDAPFGHLGSTLPGARPTMAFAVNAQLAASAPDNVAIVDCDRLAALVGKRRWFDARYWHLAKQAVALDALPLLARHTAAVVAARLGRGRKCLVLDLDNTLWGGIVGEDGLNGIRLGGTPEGEAFQAFQDSILALQQRGIILAVCSKNNEQDAREVFERHPEMRLTLDDIAVFVADWRSKPEQLSSVVQMLGVGADSLVFVDDNPAEREAVRRLMPEVDVITLPRDPAGYVQALEDYLLFEPSAFTSEDANRTEHYRARTSATAAAASAETIEDFYGSLEMRAVVSHFSDDDLPRIAQLVGKTNQFNLTTRRHSLVRLREFTQDPACVHLSFRLADRFAEHGLVAVAIAFERETALVLDTWLMSCRVIGRTLEASVLQELCRAATARGCAELRGVYVPTAKNEIVRDLLERLGFELVEESEGMADWVYDLERRPSVVNDFIEVVRTEEVHHAGA
jgi:FkbH-like protein